MFFKCLYSIQYDILQIIWNIDHYKSSDRICQTMVHTEGVIFVNIWHSSWKDVRNIQGNLRYNFIFHYFFRCNKLLKYYMYFGRNIVINKKVNLNFCIIVYKLVSDVFTFLGNIFHFLVWFPCAISCMCIRRAWRCVRQSWCCNEPSRSS